MVGKAGYQTDSAPRTPGISYGEDPQVAVTKCGFQEVNGDTSIIAGRYRGLRIRARVSKVPNLFFDPKMQITRFRRWRLADYGSFFGVAVLHVDASLIDPRFRSRPDERVHGGARVLPLGRAGQYGVCAGIGSVVGVGPPAVHRTPRRAPEAHLEVIKRWHGGGLRSRG